MLTAVNANSSPYFWYSICGFACLIMILGFYPGFMTPDTLANLTQGRTGVYYDINAPLMSYLMGVLDTVVAGPGLIFVIHSIVFWASCGLLLHVFSGKSWGVSLAIVLLGFVPHVLGSLTIVIKDAALGTGLFASVVLLYFARSRASKIALLISPIFLFYGYAARLNGLAAVIPISIWSGFVAGEVFEIKARWLVSAAIGMAYLVVLTIGVQVVDHRLTQGKTMFPFQQIYLYDLAALSVVKGESLFPEYISADPQFSFAAVNERYNERSVNDLIYPDVLVKGDPPVLKLTEDAANIAALKESWVKAVTANPGTYLAHRSRVYAQLVGLAPSVTAPYWFYGFESSPEEFRGSENVLYAVFMKYLGVFRRPLMQTVFHRAFIWLALCGYFLYRAVRNKLRGDWQLVFVLASSSLLYALAYFPTTPSTEFRYLFWPAVSSALVIIIGVYLIRSKGVAERAKI